MKKLIALGAGLALMAGAAPAFAQEVTVDVENTATISNVVTSSASTGGNTANGAAADSLIVGGNVSEADSENAAGNGGATVLGGFGGAIETGDATAHTHVENRVNTTRTKVRAEPWDVQTIAVSVRHTLDLANEADSAAATGDNVSDGDEAISTIEGGNVSAANYANTAGNADVYVEGGTGGTVLTGSSSAETRVVNVFNRTVTRVRR